MPYVTNHKLTGASLCLHAMYTYIIPLVNFYASQTNSHAASVSLNSRVTEDRVAFSKKKKKGSGILLKELYAAKFQRDAKHL